MNQILTTKDVYTIQIKKDTIHKYTDFHPSFFLQGSDH